jgi:hypothetical protein
MLLLRHAAAWFAMLCFVMRAACFAMLLACLAEAPTSSSRKRKQVFVSPVGYL